MERFVYELSERIDLYTKELDRIPEASIWHSKNGNAVRTYCVTKENGKRIRKTIRSVEEMLPVLRREYLNVCAEQDRKRRGEIIKLLEKLRYCSEESDILGAILDRRCPERSEEMRRAVLGLNAASEWELAPYRAADFHSEGKRFCTSRGLMVRSKSEVIIAEVLYSCGIPFRYEQVLVIDGLCYAPDFTVLRTDGTQIYWEHMGKVSDIKYYDKQLSKLRLYYSVGIVPWKNLILSFDDESGLIDAEEIRSLIETRICRKR